MGKVSARVTAMSRDKTDSRSRLLRRPKWLRVLSESVKKCGGVLFSISMLGTLPRSPMLYLVQSFLSDRSTSLRQHFPFTLLKKMLWRGPSSE